MRRATHSIVRDSNNGRITQMYDGNNLLRTIYWDRDDDEPSPYWERLISSGDIVYRRRRQGGVLYIDYSDDNGATWELDIAHFLLSEDVIQVTIDDAPAGYRDVVRDGAYKIDQLLVGGTGDWDTEGTDWENTWSTASLIQQVLRDENTVAWYDSQDLTTITKDVGTGEVSLWEDKSLLGHNLIQNTATKKPIWSDDGILFDGINDFMKTVSFAYVQPATIYLLFRVKNWVLDGHVVGGDINFNPFLLFGATQYRIRMGGEAAYTDSINLPNDKWGVVKMIFNSTSSKLRLNKNIESTGNTGLQDLDGIMIGGKANSTYFGNIEIFESLYRTGIEAADTDVVITDYLMRRKGLTSERIFDNGKLLITADDSYASLYSIVYPMLIEKGIKATFYTTPTWIETAGKMTWIQVQEMYAAGMDIQCHTNDHAVLTTLNQAQLVANLQAVNDAFIANSLPVPVHIAYPVGTYNQNVINWMVGMRVTGREVYLNDDYVIWKDSEKYTLPSLTIDNINDAGVIALKAKLDLVQSKKGACTVYIHGASVGGGVLEIPTAHLEEIIDYAISIGMDILTISELYALMD